MSFERLEPGTPEWIAYLANHQHRYAFAAVQLGSLGASHRVLDAATGVGYGAAYLADACGVRVVGVDRDAHALEIARRHYHRSGVEYREDDCETLAAAARDGQPYDAVVSFETIEHLREPRRFLRRAAELLAPGGRLIASTPNRVVSDAVRGHWAHHEQEYTAAELVEMIEGAGFTSVLLFGQRLTPIGELRSEMRAELHRLRFNPVMRLGFWIQRWARSHRLPPALPERADDFEIVPMASAAAGDGDAGAPPFVLVATARMAS